MIGTRTRTRALTAVTVVVFFSACTKYVSIDPDALVAEGRVNGTAALHLVDKRTIVSDDVSVSEAGFVVRRIREDGTMRDISPMVIDRSNVESMELVSKSYRPLWIAGAAVLLVGMLFFAFSDEPGWGDD